MDAESEKKLLEALTSSETKKTRPFTTTGVVKQILDGTVYVQLDGSESLTPIVEKSVSVNVGDTVDVYVSHTDTHITGNRTNIAVGEVETADIKVEAVNQAVNEATTAANEAVQTLDSQLSPDGVFNRLTNNGQYKGLLKDEETGDIVLNADYIKSGVINADLIKAGTLSVKDELNNVLFEASDEDKKVILGSFRVKKDILESYESSYNTTIDASPTDNMGYYINKEQILNRARLKSNELFLGHIGSNEQEYGVRITTDGTPSIIMSEDQWPTKVYPFFYCTNYQLWHKNIIECDYYISSPYLKSTDHISVVDSNNNVKFNADINGNITAANLITGKKFANSNNSFTVNESGGIATTSVIAADGTIASNMNVRGATFNNNNSTFTVNASGGIATKSVIAADGNITSGGNITATGTVKGAGVTSTAGVACGGAVSGATTITASGNITTSTNMVAGGGFLNAGTAGSHQAYVRMFNSSTSYHTQFTPASASANRTVTVPNATFTIPTSGSDVRLKENISDCEINALEVLNKLKVRQFDWKDDGRHQNVGVVVDEMEEVDKNFAVGDGGYFEDGSINVKCVDIFYLEGYLLKAVQELSAENAELKARLEKLEKTVEGLAR